MIAVAVRVAPRPVFLAGRDGLLAELEARLARSLRPGDRALYGLGGAGKTSVAVEYAHRRLADCGVVWQLAAEEPTALAAGFGELAAQLGDETRGIRWRRCTRRWPAAMTGCWSSTTCRTLG